MKEKKEYQKVFKSILKEAKNKRALKHKKMNRLLLECRKLQKERENV